MSDKSRFRSGGVQDKLKFVNVSKESGTTKANTTGSLTLNMPSDATEIKAILVNGIQPLSTWDTIPIVFGNPNISTGEIGFRACSISNPVEQKYKVYATIIYI